MLKLLHEWLRIVEELIVKTYRAIKASCQLRIERASADPTSMSALNLAMNNTALASLG